MSVDRTAQKDEVLALKSIFDPSEFSCQELNSEFSGKFNAFVALPEEFRITYQMLPSFYQRIGKKQSELTEQASGEFVVKYLPPLELSITLPLDYPSTSPPRFTLTSCWLDRKQLSNLCQKLDSLWEENKGLEILYVWASFLKEDSYSFLGLDSTLDISKQFTRNIKCISNLKRMQQMQRTRPNSDKIYPETTTPVKASSSGLSVETVKPDDSVPHVVSQGNGSIQSSQLKKSDKRRPGRGRGRGRGLWRDTQKSDFVSGNPENDKITPGLNVSLSTSKSKGSESSGGSSLNCSDPCNSGISNSENAGNRHKYFKKRVNRNSHDSLDQRAVSSVPSDVSLIDFLKEHNSLMTNKEFERNIFTCRICFDDKSGSQCMEFYGCGHVFCQECVKGYFEVRIKEGNVQSMTCLEEDCKAEALQKQVREAVGPELFARYDDLLLSSTLDLMEDIVYCPRKNCQYPVTRDAEDKMGLCPSCQYSFCILCKMGYHGVEPCRLKTEGKRELVAEYETASSDRKSQLEAKYGRRQLKELVDLTRSEEWISSNSKNCPHCQAAIEKSDGCNRMVCWRCGTNFCWICSARLDPKIPYLHFNSQTSACFNMLFYGTFEEDDDDDDNFDDDELNRFLA